MAATLPSARASNDRIATSALSTLRGEMIGDASQWVLHGLARGLLRRYVSSVHVVGGENLPSGPLILTANHQSGLDVAVAISVSRMLGRRFLTWAHPDVLRYLPFLERRGFLRASRSPWDFKALLDASIATVEAAPPAALWIFPQGRCYPQASPLKVMKGAAVLGSRCAVPLVHVGILYAMYRREKPSCVVVLKPRDGERPISTEELTEGISAAFRKAEEFASRHLPLLIQPRVPHPTESATIRRPLRRPREASLEGTTTT